MPIEAIQLAGRPRPLHATCDQCDPFGGDPNPPEPFMRGQVQSRVRQLFGMRYCAVICPECWKIIGWEKP